MKNILQKIANVLTLNVHNVGSVGLLNGQMGIILFYYHYSRFTQNELYSDIADELFDSVYNKVTNLKDVSFDQGVIGIAWGIRHLIRNKFVEGDPAEVLFEIEDFLFKQNINDAQSQISLSAMGMYIHSMITDGVDLVKIEHLVFTVLKKYEFYFLCMSKKSISITYINSVLFVLSMLRKSEKYKVKVEKIIFKVLLYLSDLENFDQIEVNDLRILRKILSSLDFFSNEKNKVMSGLAGFGEFNSIDDSIKYLWQNYIFFPSEVIPMDCAELDRFIDTNYLYLPKENTLSIYNGLAGIGLNLINGQIDHR